VSASDQRFNVALDGVGNGLIAEHRTDLDVPQLRGFGQVCRSNKGFCPVNDNTFGVKMARGPSCSTGAVTKWL
jgi:hypothetical protein